MFEKLKKSKTLRSLLGAASLFMAGAPAMAEAAPRAPQKITQTAQSNCTILAQSYMPLCEQLEGNIPYCYYGKSGNVTAGCGVHIKTFKGIQELSVLKVTPKNNKKFILGNKDRLDKIANANWQDPKTYSLFPEVERVEKIKISDCGGKCPKSTDKTWKQSLLLIPKTTLKKINDTAVQLYVQKAYECHPDLFQLPPSARLVVVDLLYNLGRTKYGKTFPKFQAAVKGKNLIKMKEECCTKNNRRDTVRQCLLDAALLVGQKNPQMTKAELLQWIRIPVVRKNAKLTPKLEKALWNVLDNLASKEFDYGKNQLKWDSMYAKTGVHSVQK